MRGDRARETLIGLASTRFVGRKSRTRSIFELTCHLHVSSYDVAKRVTSYQYVSRASAL